MSLPDQQLLSQPKSPGVRLAPWATAAFVLIGWQMLAHNVPDSILPGPWNVVERIAVEFQYGGLLGYTATTLGIAAMGAFLGLLVAIPIAIAMSHSRILSAALTPFVATSQAIPAVALAPILVLWVGYGSIPIALLCSLMVFFPIAMNTVLGLTTLDPDVIGAAELDGANYIRKLMFIELPLALPAILVGIRAGFVLSITGAVVGEFVMGGQGLGVLFSVYRDRMDTTGLFAIVAILCLAAISIYLIIRRTERSISWR